MSSSRRGSRADHDRFCRVEGWEPVRDARGREVSHHITYELGLPSGDILRTRISRPADSTVYGVSLWGEILTTQLRVGDEEFWACVRDKALPERGKGLAAPARALPAAVVYQLTTQVGLPESTVSTLDLPGAMKILTDFWSQPPSG